MRFICELLALSGQGFKAMEPYLSKFPRSLLSPHTGLAEVEDSVKQFIP